MVFSSSRYRGGFRRGGGAAVSEIEREGGRTFRTYLVKYIKIFTIYINIIYFLL